MTVEDENRALVTRILGLIGQEDRADEYLSLFANDMTWWVAGDQMGGTMDKAGYSAMIKGMPNFLKSPFRFTTTGWTCQGDRVAVEAVGRAVLKDGRVYENLFHLLYVIRDGKVVVGREYMDTARSVAAIMPTQS
jgi:ketosteroid isomerase-like protein